MNIPSEVMAGQTERVRELFCYWYDYMEKNVEFWVIPGNIDIHTLSHCERVLLHALVIGDKRDVNARGMTALAQASIFHDTRRKDNYLDTGHGDRAADYYREFCAERRLDYLPEVYLTIKYHDRDDRLGEAVIRESAKEEVLGRLEVYRVFKDADALDRLRLGAWCLDQRFLRTKEAHAMTQFARSLVEQTVDSEELRKTYELLVPFKNKFDNKEK